MEVEVVFPQVCGAFYKANVQDIDLEKGTVLVTFDKKWKPDSWVPMANVRSALPPSPFQGSAEPGLKVEVYLPHHENEPSGWWIGTLQKSKGGLYVVEFQSGAEKFSDIVELENLRLPNQNAPFSKIKFYQNEFSVSEDVAKYAQQSQVHSKFVKKCGAVCARYNESTSKLIVTADKEDALLKASLLIDIHLADLSTQWAILNRSQVNLRKLSPKQMESGLVEVQFHVPQDLVGLAIGRLGSNINSAREIPGVRSIDIDDYTSTFFIRGESMEAVNKAREIIEFSKDTILVEKVLAGRVIGKNGKYIQQILEKSRVNSIRVVGEEDSTSTYPADQVAFHVIGRKKCIENAKFMLEFHLEQLKDMEQLIDVRQREDDSSDVQTYFPRPGDRDYPSYRGRLNRRGGRGGAPRSAEERGRRQDRQTNEEHVPEQQGTDQTAGNGEQQPSEEQQTHQSSQEGDVSSPDVEEIKDGNEDNNTATSPNENGGYQAPPPDRRRPYYQNRRGGGYRGYRGGQNGRGRYDNAPKPQRQRTTRYNESEA
ncbi:hypothetical protein EMCRGX_G026170 [Ephydatia muelleri]